MVGGFAKLFEESKKRKTSSSTATAAATGRSKATNTEQEHHEHSKKRQKQQHNKNNKKGKNSKGDKKTDRSKYHNNNKKKQQEWTPPSAEVLALSAKLKELSSKKRLRDALKLYWDTSNDKIRDQHHAGIVIDCCSRCGAVEEGEKVVDAMEKATGNSMSVQALTSLMKGYSHASNKMDKAFDLLVKMFASKSRRDYPNVRTLNTFLRGCLWSASSITCEDWNDKNKLSSGNFHGGVLGSEAAWGLCKAKNENKIEINKLHFDVSSYEYSIALLCNALLVNEAQVRIQEMKADTNLQTNQTSLHEGLSNGYVSLARAYALLGMLSECRIAAKDALKSINTVTSVDSKDGNMESNRLNNIRAKGGKRAWSNNETDQRAESNVLYRGHRVKELREEAICLIKYAESFNFSSAQFKLLLARLIETRIICLSGGGTTELDVTKSSIPTSSETQLLPHIEQNILRSLWFSFGLASAKNKMVNFVNTKEAGDGNLRSVNWGTDLNKLSKKRKLFGDDSLIDFSNVFTLSRMPCIDRTNKEESSKPIFIELGSGSGDWITSQANANQAVNYVSVELRADRVAQTFAKAVINSTREHNLKSNSAVALTNLCCVGSECGSFLKRVKHDSIAKIFVNHPEPPIQWDTDVSFEDDEEMGHMLNSETLLAAALCLKQGSEGNFIIVTDNKWYAQLIAKTFLKVMKQNRGILRCKHVVTTELRKHDTIKEGESQVHILCGQPCKTIGHYRPTSVNSRGASYFDRLWRTGAGSHSEKLDRFVIVMERI